MRLVGIGAKTGGPPASRVASQLLDHFAVLRRPREPRDELPSSAPGSRPHGFDANPALSRLVAERYGAKVWVVPGERSVCTVLQLPRHGGSMGCGPASFDGYITGHAPIGMLTVGPWGWRPHRLLVFVFLPDGSQDARLERDGKIVRSVPIADNAVLVRANGADRISWLAPDGSRRHIAIR
jgi:hypothetical protein